MYQKSSILFLFCFMSSDQLNGNVPCVYPQFRKLVQTLLRLGLFVSLLFHHQMLMYVFLLLLLSINNHSAALTANSVDKVRFSFRSSSVQLLNFESLLSIQQKESSRPSGVQISAVGKNDHIMLQACLKHCPYTIISQILKNLFKLLLRINLVPRESVSSGFMNALNF